MINDIAETVKNGLPLNDILVIDAHAHIGRWSNFHIPACTAEEILVGMDTLGIKYACISSMAAIGPDYRYGNDMVKDALIKYSDRFIGYVVVNPGYVLDMKRELERCFFYKGFKAIKLHPDFHKNDIDCDAYRTAYEMAEEIKCPVLIHVWGRQEVALAGKMALKYPHANFILGHSGGDIKAMQDTIGIVKRLENVYADLTISKTYEGNVEWFVSEIGSKKVVFGTDTPFFDPRTNFGRVAMAGISEDEKKDILGLNIKRLLKLRYIKNV